MKKCVEHICTHLWRRKHARARYKSLCCPARLRRSRTSWVVFLRSTTTRQYWWRRWRRWGRASPRGRTRCQDHPRSPRCSRERGSQPRHFFRHRLRRHLLLLLLFLLDRLYCSRCRSTSNNKTLPRRRLFSWEHLTDWGERFTPRTYPFYDSDDYVTTIFQ